MIIKSKNKGRGKGSRTVKSMKQKKDGRTASNKCQAAQCSNKKNTFQATNHYNGAKREEDIVRKE